MISARTGRTMRAFTAVVLLAGLAACGGDGDDGRFDTDRYQEQDAGGTDTPGPSRTTGPDPSTAEEPESTDATVATDVGAPTPDRLDGEEEAGLLWMREEEQLAHDVYAVLGATWGMRIFENIAASEQTHIAATVELLDRFGLDDPAADNAPGTFSDPRLQELYDELVDRGESTREDALAVRATIEELDIADLRLRAAATDEPAIAEVYARLERASRNHLRAFVGQLELLGVRYEPTVLDDFEEIVSSPMERGRDDH